MGKQWVRDERRRARIYMILVVIIAGSSQNANPPRFWGGVGDGLERKFGASPYVSKIFAAPYGPAVDEPLEELRYWNQLAIDVSGLDRSPVSPATGPFLPQFRPGRARCGGQCAPGGF